MSWDDGRVLRIDLDTGAHEIIATLEPPLDNLAIDGDGTLYVTRSSDNGVIAIDPESGASRTVMRSDLAAPGGMTWVKRNGTRQLLITDIFGYRFVDPDSGLTEILPYDLISGASADADSRDGVVALTYVRRNRVLLKDITSGRVLQTWTDVATPYGVLIEPIGSVLVSSHEAGTLLRLHPKDPAAREIIATGLAGPVSLAWSEEGASVYVTEATAGRISRIRLASGSRVTVAEGLTQPEGIALLPDGRIGVVEVGARHVSAIDPETGAKTVLAADLAIGGLISRAPVPVGMPTGIAVDAEGAVFVVTDASNGLIKLVRQ